QAQHFKAEAIRQERSASAWHSLFVEAESYLADGPESGVPPIRRHVLDEAALPDQGLGKRKEVLERARALGRDVVFPPPGERGDPILTIPRTIDRGGGTK